MHTAWAFWWSGHFINPACRIRPTLRGLARIVYKARVLYGAWVLIMAIDVQVYVPAALKLSPPAPPLSPPLPPPPPPPPFVRTNDRIFGMHVVIRSGRLYLIGHYYSITTVDTYTPLRSLSHANANMAQKKSVLVYLGIDTKVSMIWVTTGE